MQALQTPDSQTLVNRFRNDAVLFYPTLQKPTGKRGRPKLFFSTNTAMSGKDVIEYYRTRFQIEYCSRYAKGFIGLMQSQARDVAKLSFIFHASLITVNLAKMFVKERGIPFSMISCKSMIHNAYLLEQFIRVSGIRSNRR